MQMFFPTSEFDCDQNFTGFDACVLEMSLNSARCLLPFQNQSLFYPRPLHLCQNHEEGYIAFLQFQMASRACKPPCMQLSIELQYSLPQYLLTHYLWDVPHKFELYAYYLYLPNTIKVATILPSYDFISYIAEVSGWYNLFLGGSVYALWELLLYWTGGILDKFNLKFNLLIQVMTIIFLVVAGGTLAYIFFDCIINLTNRPTGTSTMTKTNLIGLSLSVCLSHYTSIYNLKSNSSENMFTDVANTTDFWIKGNNLSSKIAELIVKNRDGEWVSIWDRSMGSVINPTQPNLFQSVNVIKNDVAVDFCHSFELSGLPYSVSQILIRAVDDVTLFIHLSGQLYRSPLLWEVANTDTLTMKSEKIYLCGSELNLQLEGASFKNVNSTNCITYNATWTYDNCLLDFALNRFGSKQDLLRRLLFTPNNIGLNDKVDRAVLQSLYSILLSQDSDKNCRPDCRSLVVEKIAEANKIPVISSGIPRISKPQPLPPILVNVSLHIPELININEVRITLWT